MGNFPTEEELKKMMAEEQEKSEAAASNESEQAPPANQTTDGGEAPPGMQHGQGIGTGVVVDDESLNTQGNATDPDLPPGMSPETLADIKATLADVDERIAEATKLQSELKKDRLENATEEELQAEEEFNDKYAEGMIIIDKLGLAKLELTDEEHEKLKKVKSIKFNEVETIDLEVIEMEATESGDVDAFLEQHTDTSVVPIVLPASGIMMGMRGASSAELNNMLRRSGDPVIDLRAQWTLLWEKIDRPSIHFKDFGDFLKKVANADFYTMIYGVLCATHPDTNTIDLKCNKCEHDYQFAYTPQSLLRAEEITEDMGHLIQKIAHSCNTEEGAKNAHETSPLKISKRIRLPQSGHIIETRVQSAHSYLADSVKMMKDLKDTDKLAESKILASWLGSVLMENKATGKYRKFTKLEDMAKIVYSLSETDMRVLGHQAEKLEQDTSFEFGLSNVSCPNCKHFDRVVSIPVDQMLFLTHRQKANTPIV